MGCGLPRVAVARRPYPGLSSRCPFGAQATVNAGNGSAKGVRRSGFEVQAFGGSAFDVRRSAFDVRRSTFDVRRSAFGVRRSALAFDVRTFGVRRSAFGVRRSALDVRRSAFGDVRRSTFGVRQFISTEDRVLKGQPLDSPGQSAATPWVCGIQFTLPFSCLAPADCRRETGKGNIDLGFGYPGWRPSNGLTLGYRLVAPLGRKADAIDKTHENGVRLLMGSWHTRLLRQFRAECD